MYAKQIWEHAKMKVVISAAYWANPALFTHYIYVSTLKIICLTNLIICILQKKISALCWNCSGDKLMIATSEYNHAQWCNHLNSVFVYTVSE